MALRIDATFPEAYRKPMKVSAEYAQAHIADLLALASEGEPVEIYLPDKPSLKLVR